METYSPYKEFAMSTVLASDPKNRPAPPVQSPPPAPLTVFGEWRWMLASLVGL
jgi:hypothetical protein